MVGGTGQYACASSRMVSVHRIANRIQPDRTHGGAGTDSDGDGTQHWRYSLGSSLEWDTDRKVPRSRGIHCWCRDGPHEQPHAPRICAGSRATERIVTSVKQVSEQVGRSMAQVALAWLRYRKV